MNWVIHQKIDLSKNFKKSWDESTYAFTGDNNAHLWEVDVLDNSANADLSGYSVSAYFVRADGNTVIASGSVSRNTVSVELPQSCYSVPGVVKGVLKITKTGSTVTVGAIKFSVSTSTTDTLVDPEHIVPSIEELLSILAEIDQIADAEQERVEAEQGRVAAEEAREEAFAQFEQAVESGEYNGATFTPSVSAEGMLSWTNDKGLANPDSVSIKGPVGPRGSAGADGADGAPGISPTVEVSKTGKVTTITITDATGPHTATINDGADGSGTGDMVRATYDANENGIVDDAEKLGGQLPEHYASVDDLAEKASLPVSDTPPEDSEFWVDTGVSPTMMRRWRGADVTTEREYEETRVGRGKNLLNDAEIAPSNAANTTVTRDGHVVRIQGTGATYRSGQVDVYLPAGTYTIKADITVTSGVARIARRVSADGGKTYPSVITDSSPSGAEGYTFTVSQGGWNRFSFYATWTTVEDGDVTYSNIRLYAGMEAAAFEPYEGVPFLAIDNGVGQMQSVALAVGCHAIQSGTGEASPSNVRAISGRESVEVRACGKNLFDVSALTASADDTTCTASGNSVRVYTTGEGGTWRGAKTPDFAIHAGMTYTLSATLSTYVSGYARVGLRSADDNAFVSGATLLFNATTGKLSATFTPGADDEVYLSILCTSGTVLTGDCTFTDIQLEVGGAATAYEPYRALGGGTVTPTEPLYGLPEAMDSVDISVDGGVSLTRRTKLVTMDGAGKSTVASTMPCADGAYAYVTSATGALQMDDFPALCSHFAVAPKDAPTSQRVAGTMMAGLTSSSAPNIWFFSDQPSVEAFNTWLAAQAAADTPVTIVYEMAEPTAETPSAIAPIAPQPGVVNIFTDADTFSATITGSGWDTIGDMGGLEAQLAAKADAADLSAVATSGSYNDLSDKPTIPPAVTIDTTITEGGTNPVTGGAIYTALAGKADASHTQAAGTITAGTLGGQVKANATAVAALDVAQVRSIRAGTADLTPGESALATGEVYLVYE